MINIFKKLFIVIIAILLLTSCTNDLKTNIDSSENTDNIADDNDTDDGINEDTNSDIDSTIKKYTGELITDGHYSDSGSLAFVPDKETKEYFKNNFPFKFDESMYLTYDNSDIVKGLPTELGIYKVEIEPDIDGSDYYMKINSIKLTDKIGTVEYEGKTYETNNIDENVRVKDIVCGLIVKNVYYDPENTGINILFAGNIEVEGIYSVFNGGEWYNNANLGFIYPDSESKKKLPIYSDETVKDYISPIYFTETNDLYKKLTSHSAIGHGKFKISNYRIMYNIGTELTPIQILTEVISLDEKSKRLFEFNENLKSIYGITDEYILVRDETVTEDVSKKYPEEIQQEGPNDMSGKGAYYVIGRKNFSKIKLLHPYIYSYYWEKTSELNQDNQTKFDLVSDGYNYITRKIEQPHRLECNFYTGADKSEDNLGVTKNFATFIDGDNTRTIFIGQEFLGMKAKHIFIKNAYGENDAEPLFRNIVQFSGETTITGELSYSFDTGFINNYVAIFSPDEESLKLLPRLACDDRKGDFVLSNENIKELLGTEEFNKKCKITIKNYNIAYAQSFAFDVAEMVSIEELAE